MDLTFEKSTHIGLGFANQADAFQSGREAAQMAKSQIPPHENDLIFAFCPSGIHFKDFVEGVRLVTGEDKLIGIPVDWVLSNDLPSLGSCLVLIAQFASVYASIASAPETLTDEASVTALITQFRQWRGSARHVYDHHGMLLLENRNRKYLEGIAKQWATDADFETWLMGLSPSGREENPIICRNQIVRSGFSGIEFFSNSPIGIGNVALESFSGQPDIYKEAARSAIRDALAQMEEKAIAFGLLFFTPPAIEMNTEEKWAIFRSATTTLPNTPLIMIPSQNQFARTSNRSTALQHGALMTLLVPK